jgi:hypothetical protein
VTTEGAQEFVTLAREVEKRVEEVSGIKRPVIEVED